MDGWSLRPRAGLLGRLERLLRLRASGRRHVEPQQLHRLRRPRGKRPRRRLDPGSAVRVEKLEDFGTTTNGKVSARVGFFRVGVSTGSRAPTPGQQNGFNISTIFDPALGDLVNNGTIPPNSPGGGPARRRAPAPRNLGQLHRRGGLRHRAVQLHRRLLPHRRVGPHRHHQQLHPRGARDRTVLSRTSRLLKGLALLVEDRERAALSRLRGTTRGIALSWRRRGDSRRARISAPGCRETPRLR